MWYAATDGGKCKRRCVVWLDRLRRRDIYISLDRAANVWYQWMSGFYAKRWKKWEIRNVEILFAFRESPRKRGQSLGNCNWAFLTSGRVQGGDQLIMNFCRKLGVNWTVSSISLGILLNNEILLEIFEEANLVW